MLMVLSQHSRMHYVAPRRSFTGVNWHGANYPSCSGLNGQSSSLIKIISEDVFVVGKGYDELDNEKPVSSDNSTASSIVANRRHYFRYNSVRFFFPEYTCASTRFRCLVHACI